MMDRVIETLAKLEQHAAEQRAFNEAQKSNIERFWAKDWRELIDRIDRVVDEQSQIKHRLHQLELTMHPVPERVAKLEGKCESLEKRLQSMAISIIAVGVMAIGSAATRMTQLFGI